VNEYKKYLEIKEINLLKLKNTMKRKISINTNYCNDSNTFFNSSYINQNKIKVNPNSNNNNDFIKNHNENE